MSDRYRPGDHYLIDDRTGFKIRRSDAREEWNGLIVDKRAFEARHPQDFVRGVEDDQAVDDPRPRPIDDTFIGPLTTEVNATAAAGSTSITVLDATRFEAGDRIAIMLDNGDRHLTTVFSVPDGTTLSIGTALPWSTSAGRAVINYTADSAADIG